MTRSARIGAALLAVCSALMPLSSREVRGQASSPPPDADWRYLETDHFRITFTAELLPLTEGVALRAERAWAFLEERFIEAPSGRIELVLTDHVDDANGFTQVTPRGRIVLLARPPVDDFTLTHYQDWLSILITHELTHLFQLERRGPLGALAGLFLGRFPETWPRFPERALPGWALEGVATWYESAGTGAGRLYGSAHPMILRTAAAEGAFEGLGAASGESERWPEGIRPYVFGAFFIDELVGRFGEPAVSDWVRAVEGQWIPFRIDAAARSAFGSSFTELWGEWEERMRAGAEVLNDRLETLRSFTVTDTVVPGERYHLHPSLSPDGTILGYMRSDGRSDPALVLRELDTGALLRETRVNGVGGYTWAPDGGIVFSQPETSGRYRSRSDLQRVDAGGGTLRLSRDARLDHPTLDPDGASGVAVRYVEGGTELVEFDLEPFTTRPLVPAAPEVHWAEPSISPDGRSIAVSRWSPEGFSDLVLLDRSGGVVATLTEDAFDDLTPTWSADGAWILWVSDRTGIQNVFAVRTPAAGAASTDVTPIQLTHLPGGAATPALDPSGVWLYFASYHAGGWQIERTRFDPDPGLAPLPHLASLLPDSAPAGLAPRSSGGKGTAPPPLEVPYFGGVPTGIPPVAGDSIPPALDDRPYRSLRYLLPTYLEPWVEAGTERAGVQVLGYTVGLRTRATDLVGRWAYDAEGYYEPDGERWSGRFGLSLFGLGNPVVSVSASQSWGSGGPFSVRTADTVVGPFFFAERERRAGASFSFLSRSWRRATTLTLSGSMVQEARDFYDEELDEVPLNLDALPPSSRLAEGALTVAMSTARARARSITTEAGASGFVRARLRRDLRVPEGRDGEEGFDRSLEDVVGELRLYQGIRIGGFANHVLALRGSVGWSTGPGANAFHFDLGGASGAPEDITGLALFGGSRLQFPLRGLERGIKSGSRVWSASAEYRIPLARANAGAGSFPLHLDDVYLTLFSDAGDAWGPDDGPFRNPAGDPVVSVGGELAVELLPFWTHPVTLRGGVGLPVAGLPEREALFHIRLGVSF